jgi:small-conductance mechanosensitive channel
MRADSFFERTAAGLSVFWISALLLKTMDALNSKAVESIEISGQVSIANLQRRIVILLASLAWLFFYAVGCQIGSARYIRMLSEGGLGIGEQTWYGLIIAASYVYSNVGLLCLISAAIGSLGRMVVATEASGELRPAITRNIFAKSLLRSLVIAAVVICSAVFLGSPATLSSPDPYLSFAVLMSLVGLVNGFMPQWFEQSSAA